jgi:hypothetical protein
VYPSARFIQAVVPFEGRGLLHPFTLGEGVCYQAPPDKRAQLVYFRAGHSLDAFVYVSLQRDGQVVRLFPLGAKAAMHVPLAVVEDIEQGGKLEVFLGAPEGAAGTLVLDIGIVEVE